MKKKHSKFLGHCRIDSDSNTIVWSFSVLYYKKRMLLVLQVQIYYNRLNLPIHWRDGWGRKESITADLREERAGYNGPQETVATEASMPVPESTLPWYSPSYADEQLYIVVTKVGWKAGPVCRIYQTVLFPKARHDHRHAQPQAS